MTTEISYVDGKRLNVDQDIFLLTCDASEFCHRHHEGVWNSQVLAFVPQLPPPIAGSENYYGIKREEATFSDGTPVAAYEQFN